MGLNTIPAVSGLTRNVVAFTSSQTWTVPSTARYVDVLVVGGGTGGTGGFRSAQNNKEPGCGGGVTIVNNIPLNGTGTVTITVGAGSNGTNGSATTTAPAAASSAGFSAFGTYVYSQGARGGATTGGAPGYKGTTSLPSFNNDSTASNYAPIMSYTSNFSFVNGGADTGTYAMAFGASSIGYVGGACADYSSSGLGNQRAGLHYTQGRRVSADFSVNTYPQDDWYTLKSVIGAATAGTSGTGGAAGGAAGITGISGGGGGTWPNVSSGGGQGGGGAGGGGTWPNPVGGTGGNGGNAGTNTGSGGGAGANTGSTTAGTGGNGGNGAAGIVIVSWLG